MSERRRLQPLARHGIHRSPNPFVQILTVLGAMLAVVVVSVGAVGAFYLDFTQTSDEEALTLLREAQLSAITAAGSQPGLQVRHQPTRP